MGGGIDSMKAIVCTEHGPSDLLQLQDVPRPVPGDGQVRVAVKTVGITFAESLMLSGQYQIIIPTPFIPGNELAGVVTDVGKSVKGVEPGERVLVGYSVQGGLSEEVVARPEQLIPLPDEMSYAHAATFLQSNASSYFGLVNCGHLQPGETVLILGAAGALGLAAIHIAKALGAKVIAAASSEEKLAACSEAGADETINYGNEDLKARVKQLAKGGVDLVFDPVGGDLTEAALRCCAPGARFLVIGFACGDIPKIPLNLPLLKRCSIVGVDWGGTYTKDPSINPPIVAALLELFGQGKLPCPPITEFSLEKSAQAFAVTMDRSSFSRPVVRVSQ